MKNKPISKTPRFQIQAGVFLLFVTMLLGACSSNRWQPVSKKSYAVDKNWAVLSNDSLLIAITPSSYRGSASSLDSRYFCMFIRVRNLSKKSLELSNSGFSIIAEGKQYDPVPLEYVLGNLKINYMLQQGDDIFQPNPLSDDPFQNDQYDDAYFEVLSSYFSLSKLLPGASKEGYLFYDKELGRYKHFEIELIETMVGFERE